MQNVIILDDVQPPYTVNYEVFVPHDVLSSVASQDVIGRVCISFYYFPVPTVSYTHRHMLMQIMAEELRLYADDGDCGGDDDEYDDVDGGDDGGGGARKQR